MKKNFGSIYELIQKWGSDIFHYLPQLFMAILVFVAFYYLAKFTKTHSLRVYSKIFTKNANVAQFISLVVYTLLIILGTFLSIEILGLGDLLVNLLASAGIIGIIAGFAFKDIASNAFAGLLLNLQKPLKKGDWVSIDTHFGTVNDIGAITTAITTISGQEVFIPNQLIYNHSFINYSTYKKRQILLKSGVSYGDDLDYVKTVALEEISGIETLLNKAPVLFYYTNIGAYAYEFELRFWIRYTKHIDYMEVVSEAIMRIKKRFEKENISIAYPVQTLDFGIKGGTAIFDKPIVIEKPKA